VVIEDDVEIGANTTIDRATLGETRIGKGTKIDNQVQIGHNVQIGENCILVSMSGIAGSTIIGNRVTIAAQAGLKDHIEIGSDTIIAIENPESQEKTVQFYFTPAGGGAYGSIAFDQEIFQVPLSKSYEEKLFKTVKVEPNSVRIINLSTIPEPGSFYPVKINLRESSNETKNN